MIFDIGAGVGLWTLLLALIVRSAIIVAVDANPLNVEFLRRNVERYGLSKRTFTFHAKLGLPERQRVDVCNEFAGVSSTEAAKAVAVARYFAGERDLCATGRTTTPGELAVEVEGVTLPELLRLVKLPLTGPTAVHVASEALLIKPRVHPSVFEHLVDVSHTLMVVSTLGVQRPGVRQEGVE